jgi:hypothetical protein
LPGKAVWLLDNAVHPNENVLKLDNGKLVVKYLPPNVTALIKPLDEEVTGTMRRYYRGCLLQKHVEATNYLEMFWNKLVRCHI